nr:hypothetical protein [Candidatus Sigynarchaeota archaeon]
MKSVAAFVLSLVATIIYILMGLLVLVIGTLLGVVFGIFLGPEAITAMLAIAATFGFVIPIVLAVGTILVAINKKATVIIGGIIVLVGSIVGFFVLFGGFIIGTILGVIGGIMAISKSGN